MRLKKVTENIVVMSAPLELEIPHLTAPYTAVITCIALPKELVFVDCGVYPGLAKEFRRKMEKRFKRNTSHLLLTHTDWDHMFAMEAFKDVTVVASKKSTNILSRNLSDGYFTAEKRKKYADRYAAYPHFKKAYIESEIFLPTKTVASEELIGAGGNKLLFKVVDGHSPGSAIIYSPAEKTLCAGDVIMECYSPLQHGFDTFFNPIPLLKNLEKLPIDHIVPGHGKVVSKEYLVKTREYFESLEAFLQSVKAEEMSLEELLAHPDQPDYFAEGSEGWAPSAKPGVNWLHGYIWDFYQAIKE